MDLLADIFPEEEEKAEAAKEYCEKVEDQIEEKTKDITDDEKRMFSSYLITVTQHLLPQEKISGGSIGVMQ
mgnify:CR=1 FL=1